MDAPTARSEAGFTYIGILLAMALFGVALAATGDVWRTAAQREREQELLFVGSQFRNAFMSYYGATPAGQRRYPRVLEDLVEDNRFPVPRRHLRRVYADPMTGKADWVIVDAPRRRHRRCAQPLGSEAAQDGNFAPQDVKFEGAERYSDWKFVFESRTPALDAARAPAK